MSKPYENNGQNDNRKKHKRRLGARIAVISAVVIALLGCAGGLMAKYRSEQIKQAEMVAAEFHFSSNYLEEDEKTYSVSDWTQGITLELYNYEKENPALVSALDVTYTIEVNSSQFEVTEPTGTLSANDSNEGKPAAVTIKPKAGEMVTDTSITVTAHTEPYDEVLTATFELVGGQNPTVAVDDHGTHYTAKIYSNNYSGTVTLTWAGGLVPDAANDIVSKWESGTKGSVSVEPFRTYEIIFFDPANVSSHGIDFAE